jgi:hypothetical protein
MVCVAFLQLNVRRAVVGISTVRDFESGTRTHIANNVSAIRRALEEGGAADLLTATDGQAAGAQGARSTASTGPAGRSGRRRGSGSPGRRG